MNDPIHFMRYDNLRRGAIHYPRQHGKVRMMEQATPGVEFTHPWRLIGACVTTGISLAIIMMLAWMTRHD